MGNGLAWVVSGVPCICCAWVGCVLVCHVPHTPIFCSTSHKTKARIKCTNEFALAFVLRSCFLDYGEWETQTNKARLYYLSLVFQSCYTCKEFVCFGFVIKTYQITNLDFFACIGGGRMLYFDNLRRYQ